jgi:membrane protein
MPANVPLFFLQPLWQTMPDDHASNRFDRNAAHPVEISDAGWWEILKRVWQASSEKSLWVAAAGVAFFAFYALIPMFAVLVLVYGLFVGTETVQVRMQELGGVLPDEAIRALYNQLMGTARNTGASFGWGLAGSVLMLLWSILFGMRALMAGLNHAYHERETRGFLALNGQALLLGCGGLALVIGSVGLLTADPAMFDPIVSDPFWSKTITIGRWLFLTVIMAAALAMCYRTGPCRAAPKWQWVSWGAAAGTALWILASLGFSLYVRHVANYETAYGVAGSVLTVMIWLYLVAYAVLVGAALNAEMERQTSQDTTIGADRPVGVRGAKAADHKPG